MRVGTKLAAILLAPLVVLGVLAGLGIADRANTAADLAAAEREATLTARNNDLQHALEVEQLWAIASLGESADEALSEFDKAVAISTTATENLDAAVDDLGSVSTDTADRIDALGDRLGDLEGVRQSVRSGSASADAVLSAYEQTFDGLIGLEVASAAVQPVADLAQDLSYGAALSKAKVATGRVDALLLAANGTSDAALRAGLIGRAGLLQADADRYASQFFEDADPDFRALLRNALATSESRNAEQLGEQVAASDTPIDSGALAEASVARLNRMLQVQSELIEHIAEEAEEERAAANRTAQLYLAGALAGILAAVAVAFFVARSITRPLRKLTEAADQLATEQLPALVSQLRSGSAETTLATSPIDVGSRDELGQLAAAFNTVQQVTVEVANEQGTLLRKGISDIFVNLARRNQALLDRQIEFIDQLEANERDPDQLENLFRLDHLATRMRRNAESLLVLAGADPSRRRGRPVGLADVVRVAVGEVADYSRIRVRNLDEVAVNSAAAVDSAHLLAELMENATQFSPPTTTVDVSGRVDDDGDYVLSVVDHGIGIGAEPLREFNELLAHPPVMGLDMSRSLGFVVIGRLAQRHGVKVRLASPDNGGVVASVTLPKAVLAAQTPARNRTGTTGPGSDAPAEPQARRLESPVSAAPTDRVETAEQADADVDAAFDEGGSARRGRRNGSDRQLDSLFAANGAAEGHGSAEGHGAAEGPSGAIDEVAADQNGVGNGLPSRRGARAGGDDAPADQPPVIEAPAAQAPVEAAAADKVGPTPGANGAAQAESFTYYDVEDSYTELIEAQEALPEPPPPPAAPPRAEPVDARQEPLPPVPTAPTAPTAPAPPSVADLASVAGVPAGAGLRPVDVTDEEEPDAAELHDAGFPPLLLPQRRGARPVEPVAAVDEAIEEPGDAGAAPEPTPAAPSAPTPSLFSSAAMAAAAQAAALVERVGERAEPSITDAVSDTTPLTDAPPLPSRRGAAAQPAARAEAEAPTAPVAPVSRRNGAEAEAPPEAGADPAPTSPGSLPSRRPDPLPARPSAGISSRSTAAGPTDDAEGGVTAAGLVRRSPKQQLRAMARGDAEPASNTRASASQRSPEEVRKMLSRYRSGLQRGRTTGVAVHGSDELPGEHREADLEPVTLDAVEHVEDPAAGRDRPNGRNGDDTAASPHAAEELPWRP